MRSRSPRTRTIGWEPEARCKSEAPTSIMRLKNASIFAIDPPETHLDRGRTSARSVHINSGRVKISSSLALLFLTVNADARPGDGFEASGFDLLLAIHADAVRSEIHSVDRFFDGAEELGVRLL